VSISRTNKAHLAINPGDLQDLVVENGSVDYLSKLWWGLEKILSVVLRFSMNLLVSPAAGAYSGYLKRLSFSDFSSSYSSQDTYNQIEISCSVLANMLILEKADQVRLFRIIPSSVQTNKASMPS
jgi:hypothetical protein